MPRPANGQIESHAWKDGQTVTWRLRFRAYGSRHRLDLGTNHEGWNEQRARVELDRVMASVARGTWEPPERTPAYVPTEAETIHVAASRWWQRRERELSENARRDYRWRLDHVLRHLAKEEISAMTVQRVDGFREQLAGWRNDRKKGLSPRSVNMVLDVLAQILDDAVEYGLLEQNPARGRRRRMRVPKGPRSFLEPDQVLDLLDVAGEWEAQLPPHQRYGRRALLATLCLAGPRISELTAATRGDLDIHGCRLRIVDAKTDAGRRDVELTAFLLDELRPHLAGVPARLSRDHDPRLPIFPTRTGGVLSASNVRTRLLTETVKRANERRAKQDRQLLPSRVTPHTLRRTFASLAFLAGRDPRWVMGQIGHTDARFTLSVYAQVMQRQRVDRELVWRLMRFDEEGEKQTSGPRNGPTHSASPSGARAKIRRQ